MAFPSRASGASLCIALVLCIAFSLVVPGIASPAFLVNPSSGTEVSVGELSVELQHEMQDAFGSQLSDDGKVEEFERGLAPMYATLPKNGHGNLGHAAVRYALHRFFTERHGWLIEGLEPAGGSWSDSSPASVMQDRVPSYLQNLFERRMGGHGLSLRELAMLASSFEHLAHEQTLGWLEAAYRAIGAPLTGRASEQQVAKAIDLDIAAFILGDDLPTLTQEQAEKVQNSIDALYPTWSETQFWLQDVRSSVAYTRRFRENPFVRGALSFESAGQTMEEVNDKYGQFQIAECAEMKNTLLSLEDTRGTGRVSLASFYGGGVAGEDWHFSESVGYLRQLGALDESVPGKSSVIVANYVNGPNNCVASVGFHTVCCINECEALLGELERGILAPTASPGQVAGIVSRISSPTVDAPRNLSSSLLGKLEDVASHHGGAVPLHGRLFAQWMHHAFPSECPYPHVSGSTAPRTPDEWMQETRQNSAATKEERAQHVERRAAHHAAREGDEPLLQWSMHEELVANHHRETSTTSADSFGAQLGQARGLAQYAVLGAAFMSVAAAGLRMVRSALPGAGAKGAAKAPRKFSV